MKIEVNIDKKYFFIFLGILILVAGVVAVNAFGTSNPSSFGHSVLEMDWTGIIPTINTNQICLSGNCQSAWPTGGNSTDTNAATICDGTEVLLGNGSCMDFLQATGQTVTYNLNSNVPSDPDTNPDNGPDFAFQFDTNKVMRNFTITWTDFNEDVYVDVLLNGNLVDSNRQMNSPGTRSYTNTQFVSGTTLTLKRNYQSFDAEQSQYRVISIVANYL